MLVKFLIVFFLIPLLLPPYTDDTYNLTISLLGDVFTVAVMDGVDTIETADITATATTLSGTFAIIDLNVQVAELLPRNQQVDAWFRLEMDPGEDLPVNSVMTVDFSTHFA